MNLDGRETGVARVTIDRFNGAVSRPTTDEISVEEPLEIRTAADVGGVPEPLAITMRTPGHDLELAAGFLLTEGIVSDPRDVADVVFEGPNHVCLYLRAGEAEAVERARRHSFMSSSCGVCGKRSIDAVRISRRYRVSTGHPRLTPELIQALPDALRAGQPAFARTGGIHASGLFDERGRLLSSREDVGRHNALDKLIGAEFLGGRIPLADRIILVSGRVSFELVQKAALAGVPVVAAVGAPSSLAVELARECEMTLLGFVRDGRFNVYSDTGRLRDVRVKA